VNLNRAHAEWVICVGSAIPRHDRFDPFKRTLLDPVVTSQKCHNRTHALQQLYLYSITSSAMASSEGGTVRPSIFAVW
jgi:hypothetical protein